MTGGALDAHVVVGRRRGFRLDVSVVVEPGEVVAVMGPSGAGKSTLLSALSGLVHIDDGRILIDDWDVASAKPRRHVPPAQRGVVLLGQEPRLFPHMTARENVAFGPRSRGVARTVALGDADEWLWRVGLPGSGAHHPSELSGGQQQRVAIARALATAPKLLLLDEPLTALDTETSSDIRALLHDQLLATRSTALIVTHSTVDAAALARRLVVIEEGAVTQEGPVPDVLGTPATRFAAALAGTNRIVGVARQGGWWARTEDTEVFLPADDAASRAAAAEDGVPLAALIRPGVVRIEPGPDPSWSGALRLTRDAGQVAGSWLSRVTRFEQTPSGARIHTAEPAVAVDVSAEVLAALGLAPGRPVRLSVRAADVRLTRIPQPEKDAGDELESSESPDAAPEASAAPVAPEPEASTRP